MKKNEIVILVGMSSAGKDTIARLLEEKNGYNFIISTTTRPMRDGESDKNPYNFVNNETFEKLIKNDELIEYREYHTLVNNVPDIWYYGVEKNEVDPNKRYVVVLDTVGLREFKMEYKEKIISIFLQVDDETRKNRCLTRGDFNEPEWERRLADDKIRFSDEIIKNEIDYVVDASSSPEYIFNEIDSIIEIHKTKLNEKNRD
jgi:guanylate kinase